MYFPHHFYRPALIHDSCDLNKIGCCKLNAIATGPLHTYYTIAGLSEPLEGGGRLPPTF